LLDPHQYGSLQNRSTVIALAELIHQWITNLEKPGVCVRILLLDFQKAFDRVDHGIIICKLKEMGVPDFLVHWLSSFLSGCKQRVKIMDKYSTTTQINAGVPQGTLLGPITFLAHINDLSPPCATVKYVDDTTIWETCKRDGGDSNIQMAADNVTEWCATNNMKLNVDKTKEMLIYFGKTPPSITPINIDGKQIEKVRTSRLLGLTINDRLNWSDHIQGLCKKAAQRMYFLILLKRAGIPTDDIAQVYMSTIRSLLEYACVIWHPGLTQKESNMLEDIQKRAMRIIYPQHSYTEALNEGSLELLSVRRNNQCQNFFHDIQKPDHALYHHLPPERPIRNLRAQRRYEPPRARTNRLKKSPINYGLMSQ
jgi:hypothetical protein